MALSYGFLESEVYSNKNFENQFRIFNLPDPTTDDQPVTKGYADLHYSGGEGGGGLSASGFTMQGTINIDDNRITNLPDPVSDSDPVTKRYAETHISQGATGKQGEKGEKGDPGSFSGTVSTDVNMDGYKLYGLPSPTADNEPMTKGKAETDFLKKTGGLMSGELGMSDQKITDLGDPTNEKDAANKKYVDSRSGGGLQASGFTMQGDVDMNSNRVINLPDPSRNDEPVTKGYAETHYSGQGRQGPKGEKGDRGLPGSSFGGTVSTDVNMTGHRLYGLPTPTQDNEPMTKGKAETDFLKKAGGVLTGELGMSDQKITDLGNPTNEKDAATKKYVDAKPVTVTGDLSMKNHKITDLGDPTANKDATNKEYVDSKVSRQGGLTQNQADLLYPSKTGGLMSGELGMSDQKITDLGDPTNDTDAANKKYVDAKPVKVTGDVDMKEHKLYGLPTPTQDNDAATKKWVTDDFPTKTNILNGFTMKGSLDMGGHKIFEVREPTNDKDAANKKYVDDSSARSANSGSGTFKDGSTTTSQLYIRRVLSSIGIFEDVTFHSGAFSQDVTSASPSNAVVNKNTLLNGGLIDLDSFAAPLKIFLRTLQEKMFDYNMSLLLLKGTVASHSIKHMDSSMVSSFVLRKVGNDTQLTVHFKKDLENGVYSYEFEVSSDHTSGFDVYLYGECGGSGFHAETMYRYWSSTEYNTGKDFNSRKQVKSRGGYFHRGSGKKVQFVGSFRYSGDTIVNRGKPYSLNTDTSVSTGKTYEFMVQKLTLDPLATSSTILGSSLTFVIEPDGNGTLDLKDDSYFSITQNLLLTV